MNPKTKVFVNGTDIKWNRDGGGRFSSIKSKIMKFIKKVVLVAIVGVVIYGIGYGAYVAGAQFNPKTVYAEKEVQVPLKFEDMPLLVKICNAESGGKQFLTNGHIVRGKVEPSDLGFCQINETIWNDKARELGYDIYTEQGNKDMAIWIYLRQGSQPWSASRSMWSK